MAAQTRHAGACFMPFYRLNKNSSTRPVRTRWAPHSTGRMWEDWKIGEAYAEHFLACLKAGDVNSSELAVIIMDMGAGIKSDWCAVGFIDQLAVRLRQVP